MYCMKCFRKPTIIFIIIFIVLHFNRVYSLLVLISIVAMTSLKDRVVVVTGAWFGIGQAVAESLVKEGAIVLGCSNNDDNLAMDSVAGPGSMFVTKCDVSNKEEV